MMESTLQHLFRSLILEKRPIMRNCCVLAKENGSDVMESQSASKGDPRNYDTGMAYEEEEKKIYGDVEYVPASYLHGKYVLLYLPDPTGNTIAPQRPTMTPFSHTSSSPPLLVGTNTQTLSSAGTFFSPSSVRSSHSQGPFTCTQGTQQGNFVDIAMDVSHQTTSLLSSFCEHLIQQLGRMGSLDATREFFPLSVLEVRQPACAGCNLRFPETSKKTTNVETTVVPMPVASGHDTNNTDSYSLRRVVNCTPASEKSPSAVETVFNEGIVNSPFHGGWLYLESVAAYRQIIRTFGVTTLPSVLLFDPGGKLLSTQVLAHIKKEMLSLETPDGCCRISTFDPDVGKQKHEEQIQCPQDKFHSCFPWVVGNQGESGTRGNKKTAGETFSLSSLLKRLVIQSRRVSDVLKGDSNFHPKTVDDMDRNADGRLETYLDGATHLVLYFGSGWYPSSGHHLPQLCRLWSAANGDGVDNGDEKDAAGLTGCSVERKELDTMLFRRGISVGSLDGPPVCLASRFDPLDDVCVSRSELPGFLTRVVSSRTTPSTLPLGGVFGSATAFETDLEMLLKGMDVSDEVTTAEQLGRSHPFQVIYVSCDVDEKQLNSVLNGMPSSWLCLSSLFGPNYRELVANCLELFNVRVFPRLFLARLGHEHKAPGFVTQDAPLMPLSNTTLNIIQSHCEKLLFIPGTQLENLMCAGKESSGLPRLPFQSPVVGRKLLRDDLSSALNAALVEGGFLFVLCGMGRVSADLHQACATVLREAAIWWSKEMESFVRRVDDSGVLSSTESVAAASRVASKEPSVENTSMECINCAEDRMLFGVPLEGNFLGLNVGHMSSLLPVYVVDAVREMHGGNMGETGMLNESDSETESEGDASLAKAMLQEYVLSEVLEENELLLPPYEGEPFLVCVQWPERRAAVLRREFDFKPFPVVASTTSLGTSFNAGSLSPSYTGISPSVGVPLLDGRVGDDCGVFEMPVEFPFGFAPLSETMETNRSQNIFTASPLCSLPHVKAFIARHVLQRFW